MKFLTTINQIICRHEKVYVKTTEENKVVKGMFFERLVRKYICVYCEAEFTKTGDWYRRYK